MIPFLVILGIVCAPAVVIAAIIAGKWLMEPGRWFIWWPIGAVIGLLLLALGGNHY